MGSRSEWGHKPGRNKSDKVNPRKGSQREALMRSAKKKDVVKQDGPKKRIVEPKTAPSAKHQLSAAEQELMEFTGGGSGKSKKAKKRKVTAKPKLKGKQKGLKVKKPKH
jgi:ribonuclease R